MVITPRQEADYKKGNGGGKSRKPISITDNVYLRNQHRLCARVETLNTHLSQHVEKEFDTFWFTSLLAQLEIWSCFQGEEEPVFMVVTPVIVALKLE